MTRRTMAERKRRAAERATRRESLLVLLSRARRGVPLTPAEAGLMFAHVEVELAEADELRRTVQGQQTAIQAAHDRTAAAEAAIREMEQRAVDAEEQLSAYRAVEAYRQAAADTFEGRLAAIRQQTTEGVLTAAERLHERAEQAEERLAAYVDIFDPDAVDDFHKMQHRAVTAEAVTAETKRLMERRTTTLRERAEMAEAAVAELAQALRLTREYVGEDLLPAVEGWSWYDALRRHAPRELGDTPELTPQAAAVHRAFVEAADSPRAQLDEQARAHAIEIAELKRRNTNQADTVRDMARINREAHERVRVADFHAADAKERARVAETELATLREGIRECGGNPTNVQNLAAQMRMWRRRFERAEHRATRYRTAWFAARRDRRADRAAMAAELPLVEAGQQARTEAALAEQRLAAVLAALPTEPRPRLGLPNDLAYTDGQHDQADAIRDALAQH